MDHPLRVGVATAGAAKENWSAALAELAPAGVVTVISTMPATSAGAVAVIDVAEFTVNDVAATLPKSTLVAPVKLEPVMVTIAPPQRTSGWANPRYDRWSRHNRDLNGNVTGVERVAPIGVHTHRLVRERIWAGITCGCVYRSPFPLGTSVP